MNNAVVVGTSLDPKEELGPHGVLQGRCSRLHQLDVLQLYVGSWGTTSWSRILGLTNSAVGTLSTPRDVQRPFVGDPFCVLGQSLSKEDTEPPRVRLRKLSRTYPPPRDPSTKSEMTVIPRASHPLAAQLAIRPKPRRLLPSGPEDAVIADKVPGFPPTRAALPRRLGPDPAVEGVLDDVDDTQALAEDDDVQDELEHRVTVPDLVGLTSFQARPPCRILLAPPTGRDSARETRTDRSSANSPKTSAEDELCDLTLSPQVEQVFPSLVQDVIAEYPTWRGSD